MRIEIAGALATGKTTLAAALSNRGLHVVSEELEANPYLDLRLQNPDEYGYLCQEWFVTSKIKGIKAGARHLDMMPQGSAMVIDYSMAADRAYVAHHVSNNPDWITRLEAEIDRFESAYGPPDLIVSLSCSSDEQLRRIAKRGRDFEQGLDLEYLETINDLVEAKLSIPAYHQSDVLRYRTDVITNDEICDAVMTKVRAYAQIWGPEALSR